MASAATVQMATRIPTDFMFRNAIIGAFELCMAYPQASTNRAVCAISWHAKQADHQISLTQQVMPP